jgi:hypothetical protein
MHEAVPPEEMRELRIAAASLANESLAIAGGLMPTYANAAGWQDFWLARILAPQATSITATVTVTDQHGRVITQFTSQGGTMATAITMDDTLTVAAMPEDDHGDVTADQLSWSGSDAGAVLTLAVSADTQSVTATPVAEGSSTITVSDPSASGVTGTLDVTVGPGATSQIVLTPTVNTGANTVPPPA